jgi:hypothetical protein
VPPASLDADDLGTVEYLVVEFPDGRVHADAFSPLLDLVDRDAIRVLDLEFVTKDAAGQVRVLDPVQVIADADGDLSAFLGATSLILTSDDHAAAGELATAGSTLAVVVYENEWTASMAVALRRHGGRLVSAGSVAVQDLTEALGLAPTETEGA